MSGAAETAPFASPDKNSAPGHVQGVGGDAVGQLPPDAKCEVGGASHMDCSECADALQKKPCKDVANPEGGASVCNSTKKTNR